MKFKLEDFKLWAVSLAYATILLLCGRATVKPADRSDRPWVGKPVEELILPTLDDVQAVYGRPLAVPVMGIPITTLAAPQPPKTLPILCDTQPCGIIGLRWGLERSADLKVWQLVSTSAALAMGGTVAFTGTNDLPRAFYRVRTVYPP